MLPPYTISEEVIDFISEGMYKQDITARELSKKVGITESGMSRYLNKNRKMPFDVMSKCLYELGYRIVCTPIRRVENDND